MKTEIVELTYKDKKITICSCIHIGTQEYYEKINNIADKSEIVLYEGVANNSDLKVKEVYSALAEIFGLVIQNRNGYENNIRWINSDLKYETFEYYMKNNTFKSVFSDETINKLKSITDKKLPILVIKLLLFLSKIKNYFKPVDYLVVNLRNYKFIIDLIHHLEESNTVSFLCGETHKNGMIQILSKIGFKTIKKYKIKAF